MFEHDFSIDSIRRRVRQELADFGGDFERRFPQGYRWVNIRTLYDASLAPDEVILCFRDVDEEKRRELQHNEILQEALDAAVEGTKAKSEFFSRMSHDMRTPLNAILGFCSLAERERGAGGGRVWEYLDKIKYAGSQLLSLINDILEFSRSEAGKEYLEQKPFDVGELARSAAGIFRDQAQAQGKRFTVQIRLEQSRVLGDEKKLTQVLNNLLSNAVKYTERGDEIRFEVEELRYSQHSKYRFQVEDTGIGMSKEFLDKLFEPYSPRNRLFHPRHDGHRPGHDDCENAGAPVERRGFGGKRAWKGELLHCDRAVRCGTARRKAEGARTAGGRSL